MPRKTNSRRKVLRFAARVMDDFATVEGAAFNDLKHVAFTDEDRAQFAALAAELRDRAAGHKWKKIK